MTSEAMAVYRFGDLLALARQSWIRHTAEELARRGYPDYRAGTPTTGPATPPACACR